MVIIHLPGCVLVDFSINLDVVVAGGSFPSANRLVRGLLEELFPDRVGRELNHHQVKRRKKKRESELDTIKSPVLAFHSCSRPESKKKT